MPQIRLILVLLALLGWLGALVSQVRAWVTSDDGAATTWRGRRNRFLLLSSIAMNTAVLSTVYLLVKKVRQWRRT